MLHTLLHTDVDNCADNPCGEYGTCTDEVEGFTCECQDGFDQSGPMGRCEGQKTNLMHRLL